MNKVLLIIALCLWPAAAIAALTPAALNSAGVNLPAKAVLPLNLVAPDLSGDRRSIASALAGKPGFAIFADYTCKTLCGPALVLLTAGLTQSALPPGSWRPAGPLRPAGPRRIFPLPALLSASLVSWAMVLATGPLSVGV